MKILFITEHFPCVSETFVQNQITELIDAGHDIKIYALGKPHRNVIHPDFIKYKLNEYTYRPKRALPVNKVLRFFCLLQDITSLWERIGCRVLKLLNRHRYGRIATNDLLLHLSASFPYDYRPDIVVVHFADLGLYASAWHAAGLLKAPAVVFVHAHEIAKMNAQNIHHRFFPLFQDFRIYLLPISQYWRDLLIQSGANKQRITVFHMGVNTQKFHLREISFHTPLQILSVGRLVGQKGYRYSIEAVIKAFKMGLNIEYTIIGEGEERENLRYMIYSNQAEKYIHLKGACSQDTVVAEMEKCDIFLLPSVTDEQGLKEGIPVALMEAMAMGCPVISTWHSGIPELIEDHISGLLCKEGDVDGIVNSIQYFINNPDLTKKMSQNARNKILKEFDIKKLMPAFSELLAQISKSK